MPSPESRRLTRFPGRGGRGQPLRTLAETEKEGLDDKRRTRFPGNNEELKLLAASSLAVPAPDRLKKQKSTPVPPRIPIAINGLYTAPQETLHTIATKSVNPVSEFTIRYEDPWLTYKPLRNIERGSQIKVACTRIVPTRMVTLKETSSAIQLNDIIKFQHQNLVSFIEAYEYENKTIVVSEYAQVSLRRSIAIPYDFEEIHISTVCSQVFDGMQYLAQHGISHNNLTSSKVLLSSDGCVKIAYIGSCQETGFTTARALGLLALEMMQKGVIQKAIKVDGKLVPQNKDLWSAELVNFLEATSFCSLNEIKKNNFLKHSSPTIMIPFISYVQLEAIVPQIRTLY